MRSVSTDSLPAWFVFIYEPDKRALKFLIHTDLLREHRDTLTSQSPLVEYMRQNLSLDPLMSFSGSFDPSFGFGDCVKRTGILGDFGVFEAVFPKVALNTGTCVDCGGKGELNDGMSCIRCNKGRTFCFSWHDADALAATLHLLFDMAEQEPESRTNHPPPLGIQPMVITTSADHTPLGASLGGYFSYDFASAIPQLLEEANSQGEWDKELANLWIHLMRTGEESFLSLDIHDTRMYHNQNGLTINCPGASCGIQPGLWSDVNRIYRGCEFTAHNNDNFGQQFTLFAGLGLLQREWLKRKGIVL